MALRLAMPLLFVLNPHLMKKYITLYILLFFTNLIFCQCFTTLNSGFWHVSGIKSDGTIWGWGSGDAGQLNNGTRFAELTAVPISSTADWQKMFVGEFTNFGLKNNGTLWGAGANPSGVLGVGTTISSSSTFVQIGTASNWRQISSGLHTIGVRTDGSIWGWGFNDFGQVGNGNLQDEYAPVRIGTDNDWKEVDAKGNRVSFGIKTNGTLWAWGGVIISIICLVRVIFRGLYLPSTMLPPTGKP